MIKFTFFSLLLLLVIACGSNYTQVNPVPGPTPVSVMTATPEEIACELAFESSDSKMAKKIRAAGDLSPLGC